MFRYQNPTPTEEETTDEEEETEEEDEEEEEEEEEEDEEDESYDEEEDEELNEEEMEKLLELFMAGGRGGSKMDTSNQKNVVDQEQKRREALEIAWRNMIEEWQKEQKRREELTHQELVRQNELKVKEDQKRSQELARQELIRQNELRAREDQKRRELELALQNRKRSDELFALEARNLQEEAAIRKRKKREQLALEEQKKREQLVSWSGSSIKSVEEWKQEQHLRRKKTAPSCHKPEQRADKVNAILMELAKSSAQKKRSSHYSRSGAKLTRSHINPDRGPIRSFFSRFKRKLFGK